MATSTQSINGIGPAAAEALAGHGFKSAEDIAAATVEQLSQASGFSTARAERTIAGAKAILAATPAAPGDEQETDSSQPESKKKDDGKKKDRKGGKKKHKK